MSDHLNDCDCCQRKLAALRIAGAIDAIHVRQRDAYRDVLTDLIADLRDTYDDESDWHRVEHMYRAMYRAEARLREVGGDDADM
jgi:hypothetical protein